MAVRVPKRYASLDELLAPAIAALLGMWCGGADAGPATIQIANLARGTANFPERGLLRTTRQDLVTRTAATGAGRPADQ